MQLIIKLKNINKVAIKTAYVIIGDNLNGEKMVLGIYIIANESRKF